MKLSKKHYLSAAVAALAVGAASINGCATTHADSNESKYTAMSPEELAEYLIFDENGIALDEKTQEGGTVRDRQTQDELQRLCSGGGRATLGAEIGNVMALGREGVVRPEGGVKLGDWQKGEQIARSGYGFRVGHRDDDHSKRDPGGNCYACHQLDPNEIAYGTLGPSLMGYGKTRGNSQSVIDYTYDVVYSPHANFPCTHMPRFGVNGVLNQEQIQDVIAYLIDPESPVNQ
jgi:sulfur-oxidizing protein SoxX